MLLRIITASFHNFKTQNLKLSVSNPRSKYVACLSVLSRISNCQGLGHKNNFEIMKIDRIDKILCGAMRQEDNHQLRPPGCRSQPSWTSLGKNEYVNESPCKPNRETEGAVDDRSIRGLFGGPRRPKQSRWRSSIQSSLRRTKIHGRVGAGRRTAEMRGRAGQGGTGRRRAGSPRTTVPLAACPPEHRRQLSERLCGSANKGNPM